jgi:hypothetical protein
MSFVRVAFATLLLCVALASNAAADVLVDPPPTHMTTSGCIGLGVWYQSYSGGPHQITARVYYGGSRVARKQLYATTHWRDHTLYCPSYPHAGLYKVRVTGAGWAQTFRVHVAIDMD